MGDPGQPLPPCPHCGAAHPEELLVCPNTNRMLALEGRLLDHRFRFITKLGEGGMSTVWMAENFRVRKRVAIKLMHPEFARNPRTLHRFQNEATAAGRIGNPHICDILDLGESPLGPYIVMEMLQGQSFGELLEAQGRIDPPLAVLIICEALKGLIAAHAAGIIHRDLKPENMFLHEPEPGRMLVKLMDFGISKFTEEPGGGRTGANVVMGTPEYMSPEQAAGAASVDARTDIWAIGVMLYRALAGIEPFRGKTMAALLLALSTEDHAPLTNYVPQLAPGLVAIVDRCLAKEPQYRYASGQELYSALLPFQQAVAAGERPQAPVRTGKTMAIMPEQIPRGPGLTAPVMAPASGTAAFRDTAATSGTRSTAAEESMRASTVVTNRPTTGGGAGEVTAGAPDNPTGLGAGSGPAQQHSASLEGGAGTQVPALTPMPPGPGNSWSMGVRNFSDEESRPYTPTTQRKRSSLGWLLGFVLVALLGGAGALAWNAGLLPGFGELGGTSSGAGETGDVVIAGTDSDGTGSGATIDLGETSGETSGETDGASETGGETGAGETSGETGESSQTGAEDDGAEDDGAEDDGAETDGDTSKPIEYAKLIREGSLYTHKSRGTNGNWDNAKDFCRRHKRRAKHGLTKWRLATVAELLSFQGSGVAQLQYWSSETADGKAKTVVIRTGRVSDRDVTDPTPRAFCVSRR